MKHLRYSKQGLGGSDTQAVNEACEDPSGIKE